MKVHKVSKYFGDKTVLQDFSLEFPNRGIVALLGPSGCGKTTLLRLMAGLERPDSGAINCSSDVRVSMVFQEDRLLPGFTVWENVAAVLPKGQEDKIYCALKSCGLEESAGQFPAQLSGGMRRRVAVARAMAYGGEVLLLDEAFKGLDDRTKKLVMDFVLRPPAPLESPALVVMVTHDAREAAAAQRAVLLDGIPLHTVEDMALPTERKAALEALSQAMSRAWPQRDDRCE